MQENVLLPHPQIDAPIKPIEPTLADVLTAIERDASLPEPKREAWCCSIRRMQISSKESLRSCRPGSWLCGSGSRACIMLNSGSAERPFKIISRTSRLQFANLVQLSV